MRNQRLPAELEEQLRIVERTGGSIDHVSVDAAILAVGAKGFLPNSRKLFWPEKPCHP